MTHPITPPPELVQQWWDDFNVVHFLYLQFKRLELAIEKFFFRIRLEWGIFIMRYNKRKYLKMAQEILEDLEKSKE
jgi:hypothetical protein